MSTGTRDRNAAPAGLRLLGDVGGTNARFALSRKGLEYDAVQVLPGEDFDGLEAAIRHYLKQQDATVESAVIGIATAVTGDRVEMTNSPWQFSIEEMKRSLGLKDLLVLNDFTALAWSLAHLPPDELPQFGGGEPSPDAPRALIGPGTGLGVSGLVPDSQGGFTALAGEGGHAAFAPTSELELDLWRAGTQAFGRVSVERLVSGPGLSFIYKTLSERAGEQPQDLEPADISQRALAPDRPDERCREALDTFLGILGSTAGDLALTLGARGGVYIGGGIVPRLTDHLPHSPFRQRFDDKGRFDDYMKAIPVYVIQSEQPALVGAVAYLEARKGRKQR